MTPPILGIWASSFFQPTGDYQAIMTATVDSSGAATIDLTSIPQTFKHLQIRALARCGSTASGGNYLSMRFNGDSGSNYTYHALQGDGSSATAAGLASQNTVYLQRMANNNDASGIYGALVVDLLDYSNIAKYKTVRDLGAYDANGSGRIYLSSSTWMNTAAITSISIAPESSTFNQYSQFALFGLK